MNKEFRHVVITGGAGFIGSHLCDRLIESEYQVHCVDNFSTGACGNISHLTDHPSFQLVEADLSRELRIKGPVDAILHLASPASPKDFQQMPLEILRVNSRGTENVLELAREKGAVVLVASTSEVYGDPKVNPQPESYWGNVNSIGLRSCYDEGKRFLEALTMAYHRYYKLPIRIIRIFNTYGPRMRAEDGRVVPSFITQALAENPLTIHGTGLQTRSFCYVDDLVDGILRLLQSQYTNPVNVGNPNEMTIYELASLIVRLTGSSSPIIYKELPADDPQQRRPDISLAKSILGWEPKVTLEEGLRKTIEYFAAQK
ncbi:MAG: SDR family oxidoreductase [Deltaproteobacteria bacterium]|nr:SDR family oxidoreductase [Deltaproteobacteria bacterium]